MSRTTTEKATDLLNREIFTKGALAEELGISRPTLDRRLESDNWGKLEIKWINKLSKKIK